MRVPGLRVLCADDEPNVLAALRRLLRIARPDWDLECATTAADGEALLTAGRPIDVVVCDAAGPGLDGLRLLGTVRDRSPATARIALSGSTDRSALLSVLALAHRFLLKPCRPDDLITAIDEVAAARHAVGGAISVFLGSARSLPSAPTVYTALVDAAAQPDCDAADLAAVLETDLATATDVLKLVNSGLFCPPNQVVTLEEAVVLLGVDSIQALALVSAAYRTSAPLPPGFDLGALTANSLLTAALARRLASAEGLGRAGTSALFLAAVLADIGLLAQVTARPDGWARVRDAGPGERAAAEVAGFGCTTAQASAYLLALWGFADPVLRLVLAQPAPGPDAEVAAHLLAYARRVARAEPAPEDPPAAWAAVARSFAP
ncbi:HDOD domain-containing protein [Cryptosporangium phraense]|uniref:HDOD domain-containing protein n=1 Tax=Cryptosporangium phraense TaxID=2593070 RepID=A0A545AL63_9ACTN|nr:HDOD domain-containing protein [Cryptosporangium phraense]TQS42000.1 HDOD domain-containing protein [Cryptosporangium phraense]